MNAPLLLVSSTALLVAVVSACGGSSGGPTTPVATGLSGTLSDPAGDAMASAQVPTPPDFTGATLEVANQALNITVTFAPASLASETGFRVYLDTDEDVATGQISFGETSNAIGADYMVTGLTPHDPARMAVLRLTGGSGSSFTTILNVEMGTNQRRVPVPLSQLGGDDGRLRFKLECFQVVTISPTVQVLLQGLDLMPNFGLPAGVVR